MVLTNVYGAALTIRATMEPLRESRGHFLITGSVAGQRHIPGSLYSATKQAVNAMAENLRQEVNGSGVRVTLIGPAWSTRPSSTASRHAGAGRRRRRRAVMWAVSRPRTST